jgi:hypothetical protein
MNSDTSDDSLPVPTAAEERHFLDQCEYVNGLLTAAGRHARRLLRERGWQSRWCPEDEEEVYEKTFPDGQRQYLGEWDAYNFEQDYTRQWFRACGIAMRPRKQGG